MPRLPVAVGFDEISVALAADAWSRTARSEALATNVRGSVRSRRGLIIETEAESKSGRYILPAYAGAPTNALNSTLDEITGRYGAPTADCVALQLEYPRR